MAARTVGREVYEMRVREAGQGGQAVGDTVRAVVGGALRRAGRELALDGRAGEQIAPDARRTAWNGLRDKTRETVEKVLRYRAADEVEAWIRRTIAYAVSLSRGRWMGPCLIMRILRRPPGGTPDRARGIAGARARHDRRPAEQAVLVSPVRRPPLKTHAPLRR